MDEKNGNKPNYTHTYILCIICYLRWKRILFFKSFFLAPLLPIIFFKNFADNDKKRNYRKSCRWTIAQTCQPMTGLMQKMTFFQQKQQQHAAVTLLSSVFIASQNRFFVRNVIHKGNDRHIHQKTQPFLNLRTKCQTKRNAWWNEK